MPRLVVGAAVAAALVSGSISTMAAQAGGSPTSTTTASAASRGTVAYAGLSRVSSSASARTAGTGAGTARQIPLLRPHGNARISAHVTQSANVPRAAGSATAASRVQQNFDGIDALQNKAAAGFDLEPPDEGLGASSAYVANFVNLTGAFYSRTGALLQGPFYLNTFFGEPTETNTSDPRVFYDDSTHTWFATLLEYSFNSSSMVSESHVDVAVSTSSNPTHAWRVYRIDTSNPSHAGCPCLADYPILAVDHYNVYVSTNEFTADLNSFNGAQLYAISKSQLVSRATRPNVVFFPDLSVSGAPAYHVQPANTYGYAPAEFMLSSLDPFSTFDNRLAVWALTNPQRVTSGNGMPTLSSRVISSEPYSFPPNAQTPPGFCSSSLCGKDGAPTTGVVQTDFDAMQEVQYINGQLVGALSTGVTIPGDTGERSGIAWFVVHPQVSGASVSSRTRVVRQGYVSRQGQYLLYPHVNMTYDGAMAMVFGLGGPATYLSAGYATARSGHGFGAIQIVAAGTGPDNGFTGTAEFGGAGRWGDYSNGQIIPGTKSVWLATQYIPNSGDGKANWGNRIFEVRTP